MRRLVLASLLLVMTGCDDARRSEHRETSASEIQNSSEQHGVVGDWRGYYDTGRYRGYYDISFGEDGLLTYVAYSEGQYLDGGAGTWRSVSPSSAVIEIPAGEWPVRVTNENQLELLRPLNHITELNRLEGP